MLVQEIPLARHEFLHDIAYAPKLDQVWVALWDELRRYDSDGVQQFSKPSGHGKFSKQEAQAGQKSGLSLDSFMHHLSVDGEGGVWLSNTLFLGHINESGLLEFVITPFFPLFGSPLIVDIAANPQNQSVWVASNQRLKHYAVDSQLLHDVSTGLDDIRHIEQLEFYADVEPPVLTVSAPENGAWLNTLQPQITLGYLDAGSGVAPESLALQVDAADIELNCETQAYSATCTPATPLREETITLRFTVQDHAGNESEPVELQLNLDVTAPVLTLESPAAGQTTNQPELTIAGQISESAALTLNGESLQTDPEHRFTHVVTLQEGNNTFTLIVTDLAGNESTVSRTVVLDTVPPAIPVAGQISISEPDENGRVTVTGQAGSVEAGATIVITNTRTGETVTAIADAQGGFAAQLAAQIGDILEIQAIDKADNKSQLLQIKVQSTIILDVLYPKDGASIDGNSILMHGKIIAPANTGVIVNNDQAVYQLFDGERDFYSTINLEPGENKISVRAIMQNGEVIEKELTVYGGNNSEYNVYSNNAVGIAPFLFKFFIEGNLTGKEVIEIDFNGDGQFEKFASSCKAEEDCAYLYEDDGTYIAKISIKRPDGYVQYEEIAIQVNSKKDLTRLHKKLWNTMNNHLANQDLGAALWYLNKHAKKKYVPVFTALKPYMSEIVDSYSTLHTISMTDNYAEYAINRQDNGVTRVYFIYYLKDPSGLWLIDEM